jgi:hypothetical protein
MRQRPVLPSKEVPPLGQLEDYAGSAAGANNATAALNLVAGRMLTVPADALICSLDHEVELVEL